MSIAWMMCLKDFLGVSVNLDSLDDDRDADRLAKIQVVEAINGGWRRVLPQKEAPFAIAQSALEPSDVILLEWEDDEWVGRGGYVGCHLWIEPSARGNGLGAELVLAKFDATGGRLEPGAFSSAGMKAHIAAHRRSVWEALESGHRVPAHILAEHGISAG